MQTAPVSYEPGFAGGDIESQKRQGGEMHSTKPISPPRKEVALKQAAQDYTRDNMEQQRYQARMKIANMRQDVIFQQHYNEVFLAGREREMKEKLKLEEQQKAVKDTMSQLERSSARKSASRSASTTTCSKTRCGRSSATWI